MTSERRVKLLKAGVLGRYKAQSPASKLRGAGRRNWFTSSLPLLKGTRARRRYNRSLGPYGMIRRRKGASIHRRVKTRGRVVRSSAYRNIVGRRGGGSRLLYYPFYKRHISSTGLAGFRLWNFDNQVYTQPAWLYDDSSSGTDPDEIFSSAVLTSQRTIFRNDWPYFFAALRDLIQFSRAQAYTRRLKHQLRLYHKHIRKITNFISRRPSFVGKYIRQARLGCWVVSRHFLYGRRLRQLRRRVLVTSGSGVLRSAAFFNALAPLVSRPLFIQKVLKFNCQLKKLYPARAILPVPHVLRDLLSPRSVLPYQNLKIRAEEAKWESFWTRLRTFKWFFEYRRWRKAYHLAFWFRRLRSYRKLAKERFYSQLFRLYFYFLGDIGELAVYNMWRRYRRLDNRYQFSGPRFAQMLQMRVSNLLVFMGLALNSVAGTESSRLGLVRINGYTKNNPYSLVMAGDVLQFNFDISFDYVTLFSDLYWVKAEAQASFIGFMHVLFSMLLFLVLRWPRPYELVESDSRLGSRMLWQLLRLFPSRASKYSPLLKTKKAYDRHQNVTKLMPYKYRQSRRLSLPRIISFL